MLFAFAVSCSLSAILQLAARCCAKQRSNRNIAINSRSASIPVCLKTMPATITTTPTTTTSPSGASTLADCAIMANRMIDWPAYLLTPDLSQRRSRSGPFIVRLLAAILTALPQGFGCPIA